jgi:hypothetical protein
MTDENIQYPPIAEQAKNLGTSLHGLLSKAMQGNRLLAPRDTQLARLEECKKCEFYEPNDQRCKKCGCFMKFKVTMSYEKCPLDKWGPDESAFNEWIESGAPDEPNNEIPHYMKRLPNGMIVPEEEYDQRLKDYEEFGDTLTE